MVRSSVSTSAGFLRQASKPACASDPFPHTVEDLRHACQDADGSHVAEPKPPSTSCRPRARRGIGEQTCSARFSHTGVNSRTPGKEETIMPSPSLKGVAVLLVEDHADSREALGLWLEHLGATVSIAGSAVDAYRVLAKGQAPHVILCDLRMPGQD